MKKKYYDCDLLTTQFLEAILGGFKCEVGEGFITEGDFALRVDQLEKLAAGCGIKRDHRGVFGEHYTKEDKPPLFREIKGRKHKLVAVEPTELMANNWAVNMREHSGEKITILPTSEGYALYREE
ncbi:hypothetical protein LCGC14_1427040 [marine sediment metagenome]|uniref:Uncharacterized protein n=1 Tax=marine sediment metagenome TaxID=412755 RepID=A0A0F9JPP6_9ZZZZ